MAWSMTRRFTGIGLTLVLASLLAAGCDEDASPTVPAPAPPAPAPPPPPAETPAPPQIGAEEVIDRETLSRFVEESIRVASSEISSADEAYAFFDTTFRPEGQWRHGEIYLFVLELSGVSFFHAALPELEGTDLSDIEDAEGVRITEKLLAAAAAGGGYVEYLWPNPAVEGDDETGSPKVGYAAPVTLGGRDLVLASGIYPPVTAADVRNRGTLFSFVERAAGELEANASDLETAYAFLDATFRPEGEWRHGEIYVGVLELDGTSFFHAVSREIEGQDLSNLEDSQGVRITEALLAGAAAGEFVEYWYDNPAIEGDEETGSPKVAYGIGLTIGSVQLVIGSGFYPDHPEE